MSSLRHTPMRPVPDRVFRALRELARALFVSETPVPESRLDWLDAELRRFFEVAGPQAALSIRLSVGLVQIAPIFLIGAPHRFSRLDPAERSRCLERIDRSPFRFGWWVVKLYLSLLYFEHPELEARIGYDRRPLGMPQ